MKRFYISLVLFAILALELSHGSEGDRKLIGLVNPNRNTPCDPGNNLVYIRADGSSDSIHYLWSTGGSFSVLMAKTSLDSNLTIEWEQFCSDNKSDSIDFTEPPMYASVMVFTRLYEYDDPDDKNDIGAVSNDSITIHYFKNLTWAVDEASNVSDTEFSATLTVVSDEFESFGNNSLRFNLKAYGHEAHAEKLPHLLHTPSSFQLELILNNVKSVYNNTRFVLETIAYANESNGKYDIYAHQSIDDEYTPSVFKTYEMASPSSNNGGLGSFLQWKPICYTTTDHTTQKSTETSQKMGDEKWSDRTDELVASLVTAYAHMVDLYLNGSLNISYGLQGDNYYQATNYLTWTATFGLGVPPSEKFSTLVIAVIIVGFGVPALLILSGGILILVRRCKSRDDELNLSSAKLFDEDEQ